MEWWKQDGPALRGIIPREDEAGLRFWIYPTGFTAANSRTKRTKLCLPTGSCTGCSHEFPLRAKSAFTTKFLVTARRIDPRDYVHQAANCRPSRDPALPITSRWPAVGAGPTRNSAIPTLKYKPKLLIGSRLVFIDGTPDHLDLNRSRTPSALCCLRNVRQRQDQKLAYRRNSRSHYQRQTAFAFATICRFPRPACRASTTGQSRAR